MRRRLVRLVVAVVSVAGLVGADVPRADGLTPTVALVFGMLTTATGFGYPCVGPSSEGPTVVDPLLCSERMVNMHFANGDTTPTALTRTLTLAGPLSAIPNVGLDVHHNTTAITSVYSVVCANIVANVAKANKAPLHAGPCAFSSIPSPLNTVAGNCRVFTGSMVQRFIDALGNVFHLDLHFSAVVSLLVMTGHVYKPGSSQTGKVFGTIDWTPVPTTPDLENSCERKTATAFTYSGWLTFVGI